MTKEERLARAREKMDRLRKVSQTRGRRADRMEWKPKAKIYVHPASDLHDRLRIWFPKVIEIKDDGDKGGKGKKKRAKTKVVNVPFNVPSDPDACPFQKLRSILRERDDIEEEEIIISVGSGRDKVELCKGEILGLDGYDFRKSLRPTADFVCAAIKVADKNGKRPDDLKCEVLAGAKSLAADIRKEIDSEVDESGEEEGNPFFSPYPFIIEFDEQERGSDMYSARARVQERPGDDDELVKLLDADPPELENEIKLDSVKEMLKVLDDAIVYDGIEIELDVPEEEEKEEEPEKKEPAKRERRVKEEPAEEAAEEPTEEPEEPETEEEPPEEEPAAEAPEEPDPEPEEDEDEVERIERLLKEAKAKKKAAAAAKKKAEEKPKAKREPRKKAEPKEKAEPKKAAKKEKKAKEEKKEELGWEPAEGEEYDVCPKCRKPVSQEAEKCPHPGCDAEYVVEGDPF